MTTSNHRPFTYPDGRIDIPSHTGRAGAVKYTDFAINKFLKACEKKPWYPNTLFVIVADHCASSAGSTELPIEKYHIPMIVFSPAHIQPQVVSQLMSQIDVLPTLLGLLNFDYTTRFLGVDIFKTKPEQQRVFISTYQQLGFVKGNQLTVLEPKAQIKNFKVEQNTTSVSIAGDPTIETEAIAWYEVANYSYQHHAFRVR